MLGPGSSLTRLPTAILWIIIDIQSKEAPSPQMPLLELQVSLPTISRKMENYDSSIDFHQFKELSI